MSQGMARWVLWPGLWIAAGVIAVVPQLSFAQGQPNDRQQDRRMSAPPSGVARPPVVVFRQRTPVPSVTPRAIVVIPQAAIGYGNSYFFDNSTYPYVFPYSLGVDGATIGPYFYPPVFADGQQQFGPQAVQRFMGVNPGPGPAAVAAPAVRPQPNLAPAPAAPALAAPPPSDAKAKAKAWRLIDQGDADFAQNRFAQAIEHYRDASAAARDLAEAIFRQGHVLVAEGHNADAVKQYRRGLELDPAWATSDFQLDQLYGENKFRKAAQFRVLERTVAAHPHDADLLIVLGVWHYFDGQKEAAGDDFRRAAALLAVGPDDPFAGFYKNLPAAKNAVPPPPAANPPPAAALPARGN